MSQCLKATWVLVTHLIKKKMKWNEMSREKRHKRHRHVSVHVNVLGKQIKMTTAAVTRETLQIHSQQFIRNIKLCIHLHYTIKMDLEMETDIASI